MIRPGSAPIYVRRWPRISASSRMPPRLILTNLRSRARAMLRPSDVLPTPGGPTKHRIGVCSVRLLGAVGSAAGPVGAGTTGSEGDSGPGGDAGAGGDAGGSAD